MSLTQNRCSLGKQLPNSTNYEHFTQRQFPAEAAQRELREETGFRAANLKKLYSKKRPSGTIKQTLHFFIARGLEEKPLVSAEYSDIRIVPVTAAKALELAKTGKIKDEMAEAIIKATKRLPAS